MRVVLDTDVLVAAFRSERGASRHPLFGATKTEVKTMRNSNFALRLQPSLLSELRSIAEIEGVAVNQLINVAIAEKLAQLRTAKWFSDRIAMADPAAGAALIRDLRRGGGEKPRKGDAVIPVGKRQKSSAR